MAWPLTGRDRELEAVGALLADDLAGGVVLAGAAGVGKTRLAGEAARIAESRGLAVEWVRATRSAASIPLGAFAALLPPAGGGEGVELLARVRHTLAERAGGRRLVLCVDDGQLLDEASAALVHQLVAAREAFAVVTLRRGVPVADALRALWKDELCELLELDALARDEVDRLLEAALGGPVNGPTLTALWDHTRGNALFVRELVRYGAERGVLAQDGGLWRWRGEMAAGMRLAELVGARLDALDPAAREVLEIVAIGAPLEVGLLEPPECAATDALEAHEVVTYRADERRRLVDVAHPLHGEVMRARLSRTRLAAIQRRLADAVEARGARRRGDAMRIASWRLDAGDARDPELFARAAQQALAALQWDLAERLADAAGQGFDARLALGRALAGAGRADEAETVLGELEARASHDRERAAVAIAIARNLFWALDRAADADAALRRAEAVVTDDDVRGEIAAVRVRLVGAAGRPGDALAAARPLLEEGAERARLHAALTVADALTMRGRAEEAVAVTETWQPIARRYRDDLPLAEPALLATRAHALLLAGRLVEATVPAEQAYELELARRSAQNTALAAASLGAVWLARGRVRTALRSFRESAALLRDADPVSMLPWALAGIAQAAAQAGEADAALQAVEEMDGKPLGHKGFEPELGLARAWSAAAAGELSRARAHAGETAVLARSRGQDAYVMRALHELCRLGEPDAAQLGQLEVDGPFARAAAAHAAALQARDGTALMDVAERFAELDALLVAAEAADAAAAEHRDAGRAASATAAAARAAQWLRDAEEARPPTLLGPPVAAELTGREREIALLAASGHSSREIADRLVVSVRTVDNHLQRAYRKLGVTRRQELADALSAAPE